MAKDFFFFFQYIKLPPKATANNAKIHFSSKESPVFGVLAASLVPGDLLYSEVLD